VEKRESGCEKPKAYRWRTIGKLSVGGSHTKGGSGRVFGLKNSVGSGLSIRSTGRGLRVSFGGGSAMVAKSC